MWELCQAKDYLCIFTTLSWLPANNLITHSETFVLNWLRKRWEIKVQQLLKLKLKSAEYPFASITHGSLSLLISPSSQFLWGFLMSIRFAAQVRWWPSMDTFLTHLSLFYSELITLLAGIQAMGLRSNVSLLLVSMYACLESLTPQETFSNNKWSSNARLDLILLKQKILSGED